MNTNNATENMMIHLTGKRPSSKQKTIKFPIKLMYALESGCYDEIMSWSPSGLAFVIMNPQSFEKKVLPDLFKEAKFSSFDRKIKRWGFVKAKVNRGTKSCCYGHPDFQRGNYSLCMKISCSQKQQNHVFGFLQGPASSEPTSPSSGLSSNPGLFITNGATNGFGPNESAPFLTSPACILDNIGSNFLRADDPTHIARLTNGQRHKVQHRSRSELGFMSDGISAGPYPPSSIFSSSTGSRSILYEETNDRSHAEGLFCQHPHLNEYHTMSAQRQMAFELARMKDRERKRSIASSLAHSNVSNVFSEDRRTLFEITKFLQGGSIERRSQDSSIQFGHRLSRASTSSESVGSKLNQTHANVRVKEVEELRKTMIIRNALKVLGHDL